MRRSICFSEIHACYAGEVNNWKFIFRPASNLSKGACLKFDIRSKGGDLEWQAPQTDMKVKENLIWASMPGASEFGAEMHVDPETQDIWYEFELPADLAAGDTLSIHMGTPNESDARTKGNRAQKNIKRRRPFHLYINTKGKKGKEPASYHTSTDDLFNIDIRGGKLHNIRVITPGKVFRNQQFDVFIRFEDQFGNLTSNADPDTLVQVQHENQREDVSWKLYVPDTGFCNLPNLYFTEAGVFRFTLTNLITKQIFYSPPIKCTREEDGSLFWGELHGCNTKYDSNEEIESTLRHERDELAFNFFATSNFEDVEETTNDDWKRISTHIQDLNEDERFSTFLGFQWSGSSGKEGNRLFIYPKENKPLMRKKDDKYSSLQNIYPASAKERDEATKDFISIPTFTMGKGRHYDFKDFSPGVERVVEIYNAWGSSECTEKEGNPFPIKGTSKKTFVEEPKGSLREALNQNHRFGFVAGGLDDRGIYQGLQETDQELYSPGITAIYSPLHSRDSLYQAISKRRTYATTGERMYLDFTIAGQPMGSELDTSEYFGLTLNRYIQIDVGGTASLTHIELIRCGKLLHTFTPDPSRKNPHLFYTEFEDSEPLEDVTLSPAKKDQTPFAYYYVRAFQRDTNGKVSVAWSSPIWIDHESEDATPKAKKGKKT